MENQGLVEYELDCFLFRGAVLDVSLNADDKVVVLVTLNAGEYSEWKNVYFLLPAVATVESKFAVNDQDSSVQIVVSKDNAFVDGELEIETERAYWGEVNFTSVTPEKWALRFNFDLEHEAFTDGVIEFSIPEAISESLLELNDFRALIGDEVET